MSIAQISGTGYVTRMARMVEADFNEMPGMRLTRAQAQRLWNMSPEDCCFVLTHLLRAGRLVQDSAGQYCVPRAAY